MDVLHRVYLITIVPAKKTFIIARIAHSTKPGTSMSKPWG